jgi:outer membrane protein assembly factor BamB
VLGNRVYATTADKGIYRDSGAIVCLDADTGGVVWQLEPKGYRATFSSPAVSGKYLVVGEGLHYTHDARVSCVDVSNEAAPRVLWDFRTKSHVESSPCIADGRVYVGAGDDGYYCFDLEPDASGQPQLRWHLAGADYPDAETSPVVADGKVFVGLGMRGNAVCCLDAATGREIWRVMTPYPIFTAPTVAGGRVFVGMGNGNYIQSAEEAAKSELDKMRQEGASDESLAEAEKHLGAAGEVWGISVANPEDRWTYPLPQTVLGAVAADEGQIYFGARDGSLYCLTQEGRAVGTFQAGEPIMVSPAVAGEHVYFVTNSGRLVCLKKNGLQLAWDGAVGTSGRFLSSPAVARGHVYLGSEEHGLVCMGRESAAVVAAQPWLGRMGGPGMGGNVDGQSLPDAGMLLWRWADRATTGPKTTIVAPAAAYEGALYVPVADGPRRGVACLRPAKDNPTKVQEEWFANVEGGVWDSPAVLDNVVYCLSAKSDFPKRLVLELGLGTGEVSLGIPLASGSATLTPCYAPQLSLLVNVSGSLTEKRLDVLKLIRWDGEEPWSVPELGEPVCEGSLAVAGGPRQTAATCLDLPTRRTLWSAQVLASGQCPTTPPVLAGGKVLFGTPTGVAALSLLDGSHVWESPAGAAPSGDLAAKNGWVVYVTKAAVAMADEAGAQAQTPAGEVVVLDATSGQEIARATGALANVAPMLVGKYVYFATEKSIQRLDPATSQTAAWMDTSWMGTITSPMIAADGMLYFATDRVGFVCAGAKRQ